MTAFDTLRRRPRHVMALAGGGVVVALPLFASSFTIFVVSLIAVTFVGAAALTMLMGHAHQFHLGFAGVFAVGAYTSIVSQTLDVGYAVSVVLAIAAATAVSAGLGYLARFFSQFAVAIVTFGFGMFALQAVRHFDDLTGGNVGLPAPLVDATVLYYTATVGAAVTAVVLAALLRGWTGRTFRALRDGVVAAELLGLNVPRTKAYAFAVSGPFVGFAGALYAHVLGYISPNTFNIELSLAYVMMIIIGGATALLGALAGATVWVVLPQLTADVPGLFRIAIGVLAIATLLWAPGGIVGVASRSGTALARLVRRERRAAIDGSGPETTSAPARPGGEGRAEASDMTE